MSNNKKKYSNILFKPTATIISIKNFTSLQREENTFHKNKLCLVLKKINGKITNEKSIGYLYGM